MANKSVTIKAAWIAGCFAVLAAIVTGIFLLLSPGGGAQISYQGTGQQIVGDHNRVSIQNPTPKKQCYIPLLDGTDIHLGDNIYPKTQGMSYNPLTQDIYLQPVEGVVYFDKQDSTFKADKAGPTRIGQYLVDQVSSDIIKLDYSGYRYIHAINPDEPEFNKLTKKFDGTAQMAYVGSTALIASTELEGNFYHRYAAIGFAKSFSFVSAFQNASINPANTNFKVIVVIKSYHGGIRPGQSENFVLQINKYSVTVPSKTRAMRDPAEAAIEIPTDQLQFDGPNYLFLYVLPWVENGPRIEVDGHVITATHFRDVGIINLGIYINEA